MSPHYITDPDVHVRLDVSKTPISVDGLKLGEPKYLVCPICDQHVRITEYPSDPGVAEMHDENSQCPMADLQWRSDST